MHTFAHKSSALLFFICASLSVFSQTILINEQFSSNTLPTNWVNSAVDPWSFDNPNGSITTPGGNFDANFASIGHFDFFTQIAQSGILTTVPFDASTFNSIILSFDYQLRTFSNTSFKIEVFDSTTWHEVNTITTDNAANPNNIWVTDGADNISIDLSAFANVSNAKVRFTYTATGYGWCAIDNILITGETLANPGNGSNQHDASVIASGPGGIGNSDANEMWLIAESNAYSNNGLTIANNNSSVQQWSDISGNENHAIQTNATSKPVLLTNQANGFSALEFGATDQRILSSGVETSDELTIFVVMKHNTFSGNNNGVIHASPNGDPFSTTVNQKTIGMWTDASTQEIWGRGVQSNSTRLDIPKTTILSTGEFYVVAQNYTGTNIEQYVNGLIAGSVAYDGTLNDWSEFGIGCQGDESLNGQIAELILFNNSLANAQQIIIENYLSAKYDVTLSGNDFYTQDQSANGDFDFHVAGIGKANDGSEQINSKGSGIIRIETVNTINADQYLLWGEDTYNANHDFETTSDYKERLTSSWRISNRNNFGAVNISVDSADLDLSNKQACATLNLVVSSSSDFSTKTTYPLSLTDSVYSAQNISFVDGDYFTFEYQDLIVLEDLGFSGGSGPIEQPTIDDYCYKLLIKSSANNSSSIALDAMVREVEIEAGGVITIESGISLTVEGNVDNNGEFTISESASLIQNITGENQNTGNGTYKVIRTGNTNSYIYNIWSAPISNASVLDIFIDANQCDIWTFEEFSQSWKYDYSDGYSTTCKGSTITFSDANTIAGGDGIMNIARGYFIPGDLQASRKYSGEVNNGDYTMSVTTTNLGNPGGVEWGDDDWNLLGNPYPSGLDAATFWQENAIDNNRIKDALYFWDEADTIDGYNATSDYASWSAAGAVESGNSNKLPLGAVASGQGFWVVANTTSDVIFNNSMRVSSNSQFFKKSPNAEKHNAWFRLESPSNIKNNILIGYNKNTTDDLDQGYDAHKLAGTSLLKLASLYNNDELVIQSLAPFKINESKSIRLSVYTDETGTHTFSEYRRENIPANFMIYIRDNELNITHDLSKEAYTVDLIAKENYKNRFEIVFINSRPKDHNTIISEITGAPTTTDSTNAVTSVPNYNNSEFKLIQTTDGVSIYNEDGISGTIKVLDVTGKIIYTKTNMTNSASIEVSLPNVASGVYFIELINNNQRIFSSKFMKQ